MPGKTMKQKALRGKTRKATMKVTKTLTVKPLPDQQKANVLAVVRRMISRGIANKTVGNNIENGVFHNQQIAAADCYSILPQILPEGTAGGISTQLRSTDRIKPKSLTVRGQVSFAYPPNTSSTSLPVFVRVMILQQKDIKNSGSVNGNVDTANLLHAGLPTASGGDQVNYDGTTLRHYYPINKNKFRVYMDKSYYLHTSDLLNGFGGDNIGIVKKFKYTFKDLPSALTFDEGAGNNVNNFAPFIAIGYCYADGSAPSLPTITWVRANVYSQLVFEDA